MLERMKKLGEDIRAKILDRKYTTELASHMKKADAIDAPIGQAIYDIASLPDTKYFNEKGLTPEFIEQRCFPYYLKLLAIACTFNMREELEVLLSVETQSLFKENLHAEINSRRRELRYSDRKLVDQPLTTCRSDGYDDTMLGIAAFHGHWDLVQDLVAKKNADVNAVGIIEQQTPLHKVVLGDSAPVHYNSLGTQHAEVAQYLIDHKADLSAQNRSGLTPLQQAQLAAPSSELYSWISGENTVRDRYCADKVRPVLEKAQQRLAATKAAAGSTTGIFSDLMHSILLKVPSLPRQATKDDKQAAQSPEQAVDEIESYEIVNHSDCDEPDLPQPPDLTGDEVIDLPPDSPTDGASFAFAMAMKRS